MRKIKIFKFEELKEEIRARVIERERDRRISSGDPIPWQSEIFESLKALIDNTNGARLKDYSLGLGRGGDLLRIDLGDAADLTGARAYGWLENNLFSNLRMTRAQYLARRRDNFRYGYRVGAIPDCPLTGYCADHDYLEDLKKSVLSGRTLRESFEDLAHTYVRLIESEYNAQLEEEYIKEDLIANEYEYTADGREI